MLRINIYISWLPYGLPPSPPAPPPPHQATAKPAHALPLYDYLAKHAHCTTDDKIIQIVVLAILILCAVDWRQCVRSIYKKVGFMNNV
jgi:hypothetical protein